MTFLVQWAIFEVICWVVVLLIVNLALPKHPGKKRDKTETSVG